MNKSYKSRKSTSCSTVGEKSDDACKNLLAGTALIRFDGDGCDTFHCCNWAERLDNVIG